jgi:hypothetical protein
MLYDLQLEKINGYVKQVENRKEKIEKEKGEGKEGNKLSVHIQNGRNKEDNSNNVRMNKYGSYYILDIYNG